MSLDFSGFQGCQNAKTVDNTITPSELIAHCPPSFRHIQRYKADCRDRQKLAQAVSKRKNSNSGGILDQLLPELHAKVVVIIMNLPCFE